MTEPKRREAPASVRLPGVVIAWYQARAAAEGITPHALMKRVLIRYTKTARKDNAA